VRRDRRRAAYRTLERSHGRGEENVTGTDVDVARRRAGGAEADGERRMPARVARWIGIICLVAASGIAGYLTWVLWGTGIETARAQDTLRATFRPQLDTRAPTSHEADRPMLPGDAVAEILIPAIDVDFVVVQGTGIEQLKRGPGHYVDTAMPWDDTGRVGIAGHRTTYLHPFEHLNELRAGDRITLETRFGTFDYSVARVFAIPSAGSGYVLEQTRRPTLVLTTCHPEFSSAQRLIVEANRVSP
jgi:sortase A